MSRSRLPHSSAVSSRSLQELAGRVAEELRDVDALHLALLNGHALPGAGTGIAEEIGEEVVEEAPAASKTPHSLLGDVDLTEVLDLLGSVRACVNS